MICGEPQMPAALLIGSNSESFGSNLHTTIFNRSDLSLTYFFLRAAPAQARLSRVLRRTASARTPEIGWFSRPPCSPFSVCATDGGRTAPSIHAGFRPNVRLGKCFHAGDLAGINVDIPESARFYVQHLRGFAGQWVQ